jgi:hypothetical protein
MHDGGAPHMLLELVQFQEAYVQWGNLWNFTVYINLWSWRLILNVPFNVPSYV